MTLNTETEQKIIASAEKLFYRKGKAGTSMQDIADDAGINRTLLNYYFRSKDQLFEAVFRNAMSSFVPNLAKMLHSDMSFKDYVPRLIETVIDTMLENPQIPIFVLQELSSNPDRMPQIIKEMGIDPSVAVEKMESEKWKVNSEYGISTFRCSLLVFHLVDLAYAAERVQGSGFEVQRELWASNIEWSTSYVDRQSC